MKAREKVSQPLRPGVSAAIVVVAGVGATLVFIWQARPTWSEWTPMAIAVAGLMAVVLGGFVCLALGKSGGEVTNRETDESIARGYAHWRARIRPYAIAVAIGCVGYAAYMAWRIFANA